MSDVIWRPLVTDLTPFQRLTICNGCGAKGGPMRWAKPAKLCFTDACDQHDLDYWVGGDADAKKRADDSLLIACRKALKEWQDEKPRGIVGVWLRGLAADAFFTAVVIGGQWSFAFGTPRTQADLDAIHE